MKVMPIDPNNTTPEVLASYIVEFVASQKPDAMICLFGKTVNGVLVPNISHSTVSLEQLLYLKHCLEVHIRIKTEAALQQCLLGGK